MAVVSKEAVLERLRAVPGPDGRGDVVALGLLSEIVVHGGRVAFSITVPADRAAALEPMRQAAERAVKAIPGVEATMVALTAEAPRGQASPRAGAAPSHAGHSHAGHSHAAPAAREAPVGAFGAGLPAGTTVIAVASGKGGVGKSTTAVNLALALAETGLKVAILDADVYGPSIPKLLGLSGKPKVLGGRTLEPMTGHGLKAMSIGLLVDEATPMVWRGPMVVSALRQMLTDVAWGDIDLLVVDMPPGTGDIQLSLAQQVPLAGAVIVSTPQDLALADARKGLAMFQKVDVPILGIIENMSTFICPHCGERTDIFGHGGAKDEAARLGVPFLGEVPLALAIRELSDSGRPVVASAPTGPHAEAFRAIAAKVRGELDRRRGGGRKPPRIVIE